MAAAYPSFVEANEANHQRPAIVASDVLGSEIIAARAHKLFQAAAQLAIEGTGIREKEWIDDRPTLLAALQDSAGGNKAALEDAKRNIRADLAERSTKVKYAMQVPLSDDVDGGLKQGGQRMRDVLINALACASPEMRARTEAETYNGARLESAFRMGWLDDHAFVVVSRYPDDMTKEQADAVGFFGDTMTCAIQVVRRIKNELVQESAFVAGVKHVGAERHDGRAIDGMLQALGVFPRRQLNATELLGRPLLVPMSRMPNGVVDLVELYDEHAGGTFFGQDTPRQDYVQFLQVCRDREVQLEPTVEDIAEVLIEEVDLLKSPMDAVKRLHELSQERLVERASVDQAINPRVFGSEAAAHIEAARQYLAMGDTEQFHESMQKAQSTARSSSCPMGFITASGPEEKAEIPAQSGEKSERKWMKCPFCGDPQFGDPCSPNQYCTNCRATVRNSKVIYGGNGGKSKQQPEVKTLKELFNTSRRKAEKKRLGILAVAA